MSSKIKSINEISKISEKGRALGESIVTTSGSFDILHYAHIHFLELARSEGDCLILLLNSDASIRKFKGYRRPVIPQNERAMMLSALECVDYVTIFDDDKPLNYISMIKPKVHVKGGSFLPERIKEEKELVESWNGEYKTFPLEEGYSTTAIIEKILKVYGNYPNV